MSFLTNVQISGITDGTGALLPVPVHGEYTDGAVANVFFNLLQPVSNYFFKDNADAQTDAVIDAATIQANIRQLQSLAANGWDPTLNGGAGGIATGASTTRYFLNLDMGRNLDQLIRSFQAAGAAVGPFTLTADQLTKWKDLSTVSPVIQDLIRRIGTIIEGNRTLQALVELVYVREANELINDKLVTLEGALESSKEVQEALESLQNIHNQVFIPDRGSINFDYTDANPLNGSDYVKDYLLRASAHFGMPISPQVLSSLVTYAPAFPPELNDYLINDHNPRVTYLDQWVGDVDTFDNISIGPQGGPFVTFDYTIFSTRDINGALGGFLPIMLDGDKQFWSDDIGVGDLNLDVPNPSDSDPDQVKTLEGADVLRWLLRPTDDEGNFEVFRTINGINNEYMSLIFSQDPGIHVFTVDEGGGATREIPYNYKSVAEAYNALEAKVAEVLDQFRDGNGEIPNPGQIDIPDADHQEILDLYKVWEERKNLHNNALVLLREAAKIMQTGYNDLVNDLFDSKAGQSIELFTGTPTTSLNDGTLAVLGGSNLSLNQLRENLQDEFTWLDETNFPLKNEFTNLQDDQIIGDTGYLESQQSDIDNPKIGNPPDEVWPFLWPGRGSNGLDIESIFQIDSGEVVLDDGADIGNLLNFYAKVQGEVQANVRDFTNGSAEEFPDVPQYFNPIVRSQALEGDDYPVLWIGKDGEFRTYTDGAEETSFRAITNPFAYYDSAEEAAFAWGERDADDKLVLRPIALTDQGLEFSERLIKLREDLVGIADDLFQLTPADERLPNGNPVSSSIWGLIQQVIADLDKYYTFNGGIISSGIAREDRLSGFVRWIIDNYDKSITTENAGEAGPPPPGSIQEKISFAIQSAQTFNDKQKTEVKQFMFIFEEYYKSASAILLKITQLIEKIAQSISR
ncbi:MAG: hypothetical protein KDK65_00385 [Chlamydiia bacterium]|nr:hypothetical protein [Chlamydiia bacterium]